jgi:hypothetical protein
MQKIQNIYELISLEGREFVIEAYRNLLGRDPDSHGLYYYLGRMADGYSKKNVIVQLAKSSEMKNHSISGLKQLMKEEERKNTWWYKLFNYRINSMNKMIQSNMYKIDYLFSKQTNDNFYYQDSYKTHHIADTDQNNVFFGSAIEGLEKANAILYQKLSEIEEKVHHVGDVVARNGNLSDIYKILNDIYIEQRIRLPWTLNSLVAKDGDDFIDAVFQAFLGRSADKDGLAYFINELKHGKSKLDIISHIAHTEECNNLPGNLFYLHQRIEMLTAAIDGSYNAFFQNINNRIV